MKKYALTKIVLALGIVTTFIFTPVVKVLASPLIYVLSEVSGPLQDSPGAVSIIDVNDSYSVTQFTGGNTLDGLQTVAVSPDQSTAYISDRFKNVIYVIDTTSFAIDSIDVANDGEIAITPDGTKGYIPGKFSSNTIWILDLITNTVSGSIPVTRPPFFLAMSPDGTRLYGSSDDKIHVIDTTTDTLIASITTAGGGQDLVVSLNGSKVYAVTSSNSTVTVLDTATNTITNTIEVATPALHVGVGIGITPDGSKLYAVNNIESKVAVIDTATETVSGTINLGADKSPTIVAVAPDGSKAFVMNSHFSTDGSTEVAVIDTTTDTLATTVSLPNAWWSFALGVIDKGFTEAGSGIEVSPTSLATITYSTVTASGDTTVSATSTPPAVPAGFKLSKGDIYFDITTTATFNGAVEVCVHYTSDVGEGGLKFLHEENGVWVDITTTKDMVNNIICGNVTSFSFFMVALQFGLPTHTFTRDVPTGISGLLLNVAQKIGLSTQNIGKPTNKIVNFFSVDGDATLVMTNGPGNMEPVSSAILKLNGKTLSVPSDFNNKKNTIEIPVSLPFGNSQLEVEIRGTPNSTLSVKII